MRIGVLLLAVALCAVPHATSAQIVVISESVVEREAAPGERYGGTIQLRNTSTEAQEARVYQTDYLFYADGRNIFSPPSSVPRSNARWITFTPDHVTLAPGQTAAVRYSVGLPPAGSAPLAGTYWSMLMVETVPRGSAESQQRANGKPQLGLRTTMRYGTQIATHVSGPRRVNLSFGNVTAKPPRGTDGAVLSLDVTNVGEHGVRALMLLEMFDAAGQPVAKLAQQRGLLYPGTSLRQEFRLGALRAGRYRVVVLADAGGDEMFGGQYDVSF